MGKIREPPLIMWVFWAFRCTSRAHGAKAKNRAHSVKGECTDLYVPRDSLRKKARWEERKGMDKFLTSPSRLPFFCFQSERGFIESGVWGYSWCYYHTSEIRNQYYKTFPITLKNKSYFHAVEQHPEGNSVTKSFKREANNIFILPKNTPREIGRVLATTHGILSSCTFTYSRILRCLDCFNNQRETRRKSSCAWHLLPGWDEQHQLQSYRKTIDSCKKYF